MSEEKSKKPARKAGKGNALVAPVGTAAYGGAWHGPGHLVEVPEAEAQAMIASGVWRAA